VLLLEPASTPYDLHFRLFGIPVRVHPMFWLFSAVLGWDYIRAGVEYVLMWVACMFVSILVHELGHVFMAQAFGSRSHIVLYSFGGLAIRYRVEPYRWQRIAVSFAGPAAGFLLFGLVLLGRDYFLTRWRPREVPLAWAALGMLWFMNLFWNALNLLPIWPLDGGKISQEVLTGLSPRRGMTLALGISFLLAALLAMHALSVQWERPLIPFMADIGGVYMAILFGLLAVESFQLLQQQVAERRWQDDHWDFG